MIHHISIAVENPLHVAQVLAELLDGKVVPFASHPGSYVALTLDSYGTMIEVHLRGTELRPGKENAEVQHQQNPSPSAYTATHVAISISASEDEVRSIAAREGWQIGRFNRSGFFDVIELWVENHLLVELLPPEIAAGYLAFMEPRALEKLFAETA